MQRGQQYCIACGQAVLEAARFGHWSVTAGKQTELCLDLAMYYLSLGAMLIAGSGRLGSCQAGTPWHARLWCPSLWSPHCQVEALNPDL